MRAVISSDPFRSSATSHSVQRLHMAISTVVFALLLVAWSSRGDHHDSHSAELAPFGFPWRTVATEGTAAVVVPACWSIRQKRMSAGRGGPDGMSSFVSEPAGLQEAQACARRAPASIVGCLHPSPTQYSEYSEHANPRY